MASRRDLSDVLRLVRTSRGPVSLSRPRQIQEDNRRAAGASDVSDAQAGIRKLQVTVWPKTSEPSAITFIARPCPEIAVTGVQGSADHGQPTIQEAGNGASEHIEGLVTVVTASSRRRPLRAAAFRRGVRH